MSHTYEEYEQEYESYLSRTRSFLSSTRSQSTLRECERLLREAKRCASAMRGLAEVEDDVVRIAEASRRMDREISPLEGEVERALSEKREEGGGGTEAVRSELFSGAGSGSGVGGYEAPTALLDGGEDSDTERLIRDSESLLMESQALCAESEQMGASTLQTMGLQREQLINASSHLEGTRNATEQARRVLRDMRRRTLRNKIFLYSVIVILILANGAVLYRLIKK
eukprot:CAMPEP_0113542778 /NCGR_PEP_ID=MMETSP0015_2-20120614/9799_1 /TAXON_ID=2838 /ORGANISM="Odontella" /LENGTH=225 /DNA_ID=CAMNT_0000442879 /DNA_START=75 /DNA_END=752 /DNA_ORIENTATION=+ /assembly_acc=CAM_ASM_000160